jgi:uncharacterized membrane protein
MEFLIFAASVFYGMGVMLFYGIMIIGSIFCLFMLLVLIKEGINRVGHHLRNERPSNPQLRFTRLRHGKGGTLMRS